VCSIKVGNCAVVLARKYAIWIEITSFVIDFPEFPSTASCSCTSQEDTLNLGNP
jgi:hypothetical protein